MRISDWSSDVCSSDLSDKVDDDIVALAPARPQPGDAARVKPAFRAGPAQHLARVGEQVAGAFADELVVADRGKDASRLPGATQAHPVEPAGTPTHVHIFEPLAPPRLRTDRPATL